MRNISRALLIASTLAILTVAGMLGMARSSAWSGTLPVNTSSASTIFPLSSSIDERQKVGTPVRLVIPTIRVDAAIEPIGLLPSGEMDVPKEWNDTGWYDLGPRPGDIGNAVIDGHFDSPTGKAVFYELKKLKPGDVLQVVDDANLVRTFVVRRTASYVSSNAPLQELFGHSDGTHLNLITCGGAWLKDQHRYEDRLAVYADLQTDN